MGWECCLSSSLAFYSWFVLSFWKCVCYSHVLANEWILPQVDCRCWAAACNICSPASAVALEGPWADAASSVSRRALGPASSCCSCLIFSSCFTALPPLVLLLSAPWPSGAVELSLAPVLSPDGTVLLLLLPDVPALPKEAGSFSQTEHCNITYSGIWCSLVFSDVKADVVTSPSAAECAIFPFLPAWSWTSWDRTERLSQALPWVPLGHLMPAPQVSLSMNNESSHLPAVLQGMVEPPLEQQIIELRA